MTIRILEGIGEIAAAYDGFILDIWGVLHDGSRPFPGVVDALERLKAAKKRIVVLSNAPRRAEPIAERLTEIGIPRRLYDHIHSSGQEAWQHLVRRDDPFYAALGTRCYHIGPARDDNMLEDVALTRVATVAEADFLLNTGPGDWDDTLEGYDPVLREARARDLPMICANADLVVMHRGRRMFCAGAVAQRYEAMGGRVRWHGKPFPSVYDTCFALLGVTDRRCVLAVGDSLRTDIAGAKAAGIDSVLVAGGIHAEEFGLDAAGGLDRARIAAAIAETGAAPIAVMAHFAW